MTIVPDDSITGKIVPSLDELVSKWQAADRATESATWAKAAVGSGVAEKAVSWATSWF